MSCFTRKRSLEIGDFLLSETQHFLHNGSHLACVRCVHAWGNFLEAPLWEQEPHLQEDTSVSRPGAQICREEAGLGSASLRL